MLVLLALSIALEFVFAELHSSRCFLMSLRVAFFASVLVNHGVNILSLLYGLLRNGRNACGRKDRVLGPVRLSSSAVFQSNSRVWSRSTDFRPTPLFACVQDPRSRDQRLISSTFSVKSVTVCCHVVVRAVFRCWLRVQSGVFCPVSPVCSDSEGSCSALFCQKC